MIDNTAKIFVADVFFVKLPSEWVKKENFE